MLEKPPHADSQASAESTTTSRVETTQEELAGFEVVRRLLGPSRPVSYEDTVSYFKIHLPEHHTWVICRLYLGRKRPLVWVPLPLEQVQGMVSGFSLSTPQSGWTCITMSASGEIERLGDVVRAGWDSQKEIHTKSPEVTESAEPRAAETVAPGGTSTEGGD